MDLLTAAQVAERLDVSPRTVARMVADGRLRATAKLPGDTGAYLFDPADVDAMLAAAAGGAA